jgi:hypothetical protein
MRYFWNTYTLRIAWFAILIGWPYYVFTLNCIPPIEEETIRLLGEYVDAEVERKYGPTQCQEYIDFKEACYKQEEEEQKSIGFDELNALIEKGPFYETSKVSERRPWPSLRAREMDFLGYDIISQSIERKDWDKALEQLRIKIRAVDAMRIRDYCGSADKREEFLDYYDDLMALNAPIHIEKQFLDLLVEFRKSEPNYSRCGYLLGCVQWGIRLLSTERIEDNVGYGHYSPPLERLMIHLQNVQTLMELKVHSSAALLISKGRNLKDARMQNWANYYRKEYSYKDYHAETHFFDWTTTPAAVCFLKRAIKKEPWIFDDMRLPPDLMEQLDPWTLIVLRENARSHKSSIESVRKVSARGRLLELAFAARIFHRERGEWPKSIDDLIPQCLPDFRKLEYDRVSPYMEYDMGWIAVDNLLYDRMWNDALWGTAIPSNTDEYVDSELPHGDYWLWNENLLKVTNLAQKLRAHPRLIEEATAWIVTGDINPTTMELKPNYALQKTKETEAHIKTLPQQSTVTATAQVYITYRPCRPKKAFAIWVPKQQDMTIDEYHYGRTECIDCKTLDGRDFSTRYIVFPEGY